MVFKGCAEWFSKDVLSGFQRVYWLVLKGVLSGFQRVYWVVFKGDNLLRMKLAGYKKHKISTFFGSFLLDSYFF